jgi:hypothetical protein
MKRLLLPMVLGLCIHLAGCKKSVMENATDSLTNTETEKIAPIRILDWPGPKATLTCVPDVAFFHTNVWGLNRGPSQACPFNLSDQQSVKVTFTDGTFILCQPTFMNQYGNIGYGGAGLQDLNCTVPMFGFLTYMGLHYYEPYANGAQSNASIPLYGCNSGGAYSANPIVFKRGVSYFITYSSVNTYYFPQRGQIIKKVIQLIEFM